MAFFRYGNTVNTQSKLSLLHTTGQPHYLRAQTPEDSHEVIDFEHLIGIAGISTPSSARLLAVPIGVLSVALVGVVGVALQA